MKKGNLYLREIPKFTQHRSTIIHAQVCRSNGLLISLDSCRKIFIINLNGKIEVSQSFRLSKLSHCQEVKEMKVHQMCYIIFLTTLNYIYVYNFMGDLIMQLNSSSIPLLDRHQDIISMEIWNHQTSELVKYIDIEGIGNKQRKHHQDRLVLAKI